MRDEVFELVSIYFEMPDITKIVRALPHIQKEHMAVFFSGKKISITDEDKSYPRSLLQDMKALRFLPKP